MKDWAPHFPGFPLYLQSQAQRLGKGVETRPPTCGHHRVLTFGVGFVHVGWTRFPAGLIAYLGKQVLKMTLRTLMYFSTGVTGRMRNRSGSSILGFGVGVSSSHLSNWNTIPETEKVRCGNVPSSFPQKRCVAKNSGCLCQLHGYRWGGRQDWHTGRLSPKLWLTAVPTCCLQLIYIPEKEFEKLLQVMYLKCQLGSRTNL